jgi:hypothetical protein
VRGQDRTHITPHDALIQLCPNITVLRAVMPENDTANASSDHLDLTAKGATSSTG